MFAGKQQGWQSHFPKHNSTGVCLLSCVVATAEYQYIATIFIAPIKYNGLIDIDCNI
jgi:hypothetical protein